MHLCYAPLTEPFSCGRLKPQGKPPAFPPDTAKEGSVMPTRHSRVFFTVFSALLAAGLAAMGLHAALRAGADCVMMRQKGDGT